jgi:hypothetical protein
MNTRRFRNFTRRAIPTIEVHGFENHSSDSFLLFEMEKSRSSIGTCLRRRNDMAKQPAVSSAMPRREAVAEFGR